MTHRAIDPNHDLVPTLRMMDGLLFDKAADEIERWRSAYRKAVQTPASELMVVGPGWHQRHKVTATPIVIDGLMQVFTDTPERGASKFLLVAMDDDGCGTPTFCMDEAAVSNALLPLLFFIQAGEVLSEDHAEQFKANLEALLEDGHLQFEGDPSIYLYRLHPAKG